MDQLLTIPEAAKWLTVSDRTVYRLMREGKLATVKIGGSTRIRESELIRYLDES